MPPINAKSGLILKKLTFGIGKKAFRYVEGLISGGKSKNIEGFVQNNLSNTGRGVPNVVETLVPQGVKGTGSLLGNWRLQGRNPARYLANPINLNHSPANALGKSLLSPYSVLRPSEIRPLSMTLTPEASVKELKSMLSAIRKEGNNSTLERYLIDLIEQKSGKAVKKVSRNVKRGVSNSGSKNPFGTAKSETHAPLETSPRVNNGSVVNQEGKSANLSPHNNTETLKAGGTSGQTKPQGQSAPHGNAGQAKPQGQSAPHGNAGQTKPQGQSALHGNAGQTKPQGQSATHGNAGQTKPQGQSATHGNAGQAKPQGQSAPHGASGQTRVPQRNVPRGTSAPVSVPGGATGATGTSVVNTPSSVKSSGSSLLSRARKAVSGAYNSAKNYIKQTVIEPLKRTFVTVENEAEKLSQSVSSTSTKTNAAKKSVTSEIKTLAKELEKKYNNSPTAKKEIEQILASNNSAAQISRLKQLASENVDLPTIKKMLSANLNDRNFRLLKNIIKDPRFKNIDISKINDHTIGFLEQLRLDKNFKGQKLSLLAEDIELSKKLYAKHPTEFFASLDENIQPRQMETMINLLGGNYSTFLSDLSRINKQRNITLPRLFTTEMIKPQGTSKIVMSSGGFNYVIDQRTGKILSLESDKIPAKLRMVG